jgi:hypothetical protein
MTEECSQSEFSNHVFNFSSSAEGGGLKRLLAFAAWFDRNGGAHFIVHPKLKGIFGEDSKNTYHFVGVGSVFKFLNSQTYVEDIIEEIGYCNFYYSYNIPLKRSITAKIKWFHLSNVLPFVEMSQFDIPLRRKVELWWLGKLTREGFPFVDFISAESNFSLNQLIVGKRARKHLSINGADQEISVISAKKPSKKVNNEAIVVGTYHHKNLHDSYIIFEYLRINNPELKMVVVGVKDTIPQALKEDPNVEITGVIDNRDLCNRLQQARYYLNTSKIENSWNSASEGVYLAEQSFVSDIPPHRELLDSYSSFPPIQLVTSVPVIHIKRQDLDIEKLRPWDEIVQKMIELSKT